MQVLQCPCQAVGCGRAHSTADDAIFIAPWVGVPEDGEYVPV
jgi:hypothetical protein